MSRFSLVVVIAILLSIFTAGGVGAQPAIEAGFPIEFQILRIDPDESWQEMLYPDGTGNVVDTAQMVAGVPQVELNPRTAEVYTEHGVQDVYIFRIVMENVWYERVGTMIEMRVLTFQDEAGASAYLEAAFENQVISVADSTFDQQLQEIDPLPLFDSPIIGWTQLVDYASDTTGEFTGYTSAVRYMAQIDRSIVSAFVVGPFVDYNFDLAHALLGHQADCLLSEALCGSVTLGYATDAWQMHGDGVLYFPSGISDLTPARWVWPVTEPVRAPELSESLGG